MKRVTTLFALLLSLTAVSIAIAAGGPLMPGGSGS
jgi:hypothetical protein